MTYEGWLSLGGNEIANTPRARGYQRTSDCPTSWLQDDNCNTLGEALGEGTYDFEGIQKAPWFDPDTPELSAKFLGASTVSISGLDDSTASVVMTEKTDNGGQISGYRHGSRSVRIRTFLTGVGRGGLDYGLTWLRGALEPGACGVHSLSCGTSSLEFLSDCPPERGHWTEYTDWEPVVTNLATNPSFEATSGTVEVQRNLATRYGSSMTITGFSSGVRTVESVTTSRGAMDAVRGTRRGAGWGAVIGVGSWSASSGIEIPANTTVGMGILAWASQATGTIFLGIGRWNSETSAFIGDIQIDVRDASSAPAAGVGTWLSGTYTTGSVPERLAFGLRSNSGGVDEWVQATAPMLLISKTAPTFDDYFDGTTSPDPDLTPSWMGAENASPSVLTASGVATVTRDSTNFFNIASTAWASSGARSVRIVPRTSSNDTYADPGGGPGAMRLGMQAGKTYTVLGTIRLTSPQVGVVRIRARRISVFYRVDSSVEYSESYSTPAPNIPGVYQVRHTFTLPAGTTEAFIRLYNGASVGNGDVWWDDLLVVEGAYDGPYFDGSSEGTDLIQYRWTGDENASPSVWEIRNAFLVPYSDEEYDQIQVFPLRRLLHGASLASGPIVQQIYESNDKIHWGALVEFTIVAEEAFVYSGTREIDVPASTPTVVQDEPYNLVPYPSAELSGAVIPIGTNYSTNPSAEVNASGWTTAVAAPITAGMVGAVERRTDLAAVGAASVAATFTATAAGTNGSFSLRQEVALGGVADTRYSINLWAASIVTAGSPTLGAIAISVEWLSAAGGTVLRTDSLGTVPTNGGATSTKSLLPPSGATYARVRATQPVTSWASGNAVRLHADALSVTAP